VLWSRALLVARDTGSGPPFRLLLVMALWANLHGSFMFGLALAAFLAAEAMLAPERRAHEARRWAGFSLLAFAAALLTPIGMAGFFEPLRLMAMPALQESFGEWLSPNFQTFQPLEIWLLGIIALGFTIGVRLPLSRLLLLLALCHMALSHARHAELLGLVGSLAVAATLGPPIAARIRSMPVSALSRGAVRLAVPAAPPAVKLVIAISFVISLPLLLWPIERAGDPVTRRRHSPPQRGWGLMAPSLTAKALAAI